MKKRNSSHLVDLAALERIFQITGENERSKGTSVFSKSMLDQDLSNPASRERVLKGLETYLQHAPSLATNEIEKSAIEKLCKQAQQSIKATRKKSR